MDLQIGDIATWVTAIGTCALGIFTIGLIIVGFIQIQMERKARIQHQVELAATSRREQAEQVSTWMLSHMTYEKKQKMVYQWITVLNQSGQPVYSAVVCPVVLTLDGKKRTDIINQSLVCIDVIPPGQGYISIEEISLGHPGISRVGLEIAFRDKAGISWLRDSKGNLVELQVSPIEHFHVDLPASWYGLDRELPPASYPT